MDILAWIGGGFFLFGYVLIALEQKFNTHKAAIALIMGGTLWVLAAMLLGSGSPELKHHSAETAVNVFSIVGFSLASMALIEILAHYRFFDFVQQQLLKIKIGGKGQFALLMTLCFFLSGVLDNISLTIAFIQVARRFFKGKNLILAGSAIVVASNAGGAWSPIGDVTSLLLWISGKISAIDMITTAFIPTLALTLTSGYLIYRQLDKNGFVKNDKKDKKVVLSLSEKLVIGSALFAFILPLILSMIGVEAYTARLFGLGITWAVIEVMRQKSRHPHESHLTANIEKIIQSVDMGSIKFLIGILLAVGGLGALGVLSYLSSIAVGKSPTDEWLIILSSLLGLLSGIMDNSALVAIALQVFPVEDPRIWGLIGITAGTGGSLMIFSSAAGVVAMGSVKEITVAKYARYITVPAFAGLIVGVGVWLLMYVLLWS